MRDPTAGFTDMQWFMYHQRNVAYFAAFTDTALTDTDLLRTARTLVELAPQLSFGFADGIPDEVLARAIYRESVASLDGLPDRWLDRGESVFATPPLFRLRYAALPAPDGDGRAGFLLVQVVHALVEGADSARLSRSQSAAHPVSTSSHRTAPLVKVAAVSLGAVLAGLHLIAGNVATAHPGPFRAVTRTYPRRLFSTLARQHGVRQRALLFGLVLAALFDSGTASGKRRLAEAESRESGFNAELNAQGIRTHRKLSRLIPFAYRPRVFQFMPYDMVLALVPPHRLGGRLTSGLREPVYAGAALEGANACVIVPNRQVVTFNFYIQDKLVPRLARLDTELAPLLISRSDTVV